MTASDTALAQECLTEYGERIVTLRERLRAGCQQVRDGPRRGRREKGAACEKA